MYACQITTSVGMVLRSTLPVHSLTHTQRHEYSCEILLGQNWNAALDASETAGWWKRKLKTLNVYSKIELMRVFRIDEPCRGTCGKRRQNRIKIAFFVSFGTRLRLFGNDNVELIYFICQGVACSSIVLMHKSSEINKRLLHRNYFDYLLTDLWKWNTMWAPI